MSQTVYRIKSTRPLVWRTPQCIQIGIDEPRIVIDNIPDNAAPLIQALRDGISKEGVMVLAKQLGMSTSQATAIVDSCSPAFDHDPAPTPVTATVLGNSQVSAALCQLLEQWGVAATHTTSFPLPTAPGVAVLVGEYLADPHWNAHMTHTSTPHLPVVFSDLRVTAGPLITPGVTPCLACIELWHRDEEPEWLSVGSQLWSTPAPTATIQGAHHAAALCALLLGLMGSPGLVAPGNGLSLSTRLDTGETTKRSVDFHPDCRCLGL